MVLKNNQCTIFIIDDDPSVRKSLSRFLSSHEYKVEDFCSSEDFLARVSYEGVGCIILDMEMGGINGLELQQHLLIRESALPIIFLSGQGSISTSVKALRAGALTFLEKPVNVKRLLPVLDEAINISAKNNLNRTCQKAAMELFDALSSREMEVFRLVVSGLLNKQIAGELNIAEHTVKIHRQHITTKLGVKSVPEIIGLGHTAGLL